MFWHKRDKKYYETFLILIFILLTNCTSSSLTTARTAEKSEVRLKTQVGKIIYPYPSDVPGLYFNDVVISAVIAFPKIEMDLELSTAVFKNGFALKKFISEKPYPFAIRIAGDILLLWKQIYSTMKTDIIMNFVENDKTIYGGIRSSVNRYRIRDYDENNKEYIDDRYFVIDAGIFSGIFFLNHITIELGMNYIIFNGLKSNAHGIYPPCCIVPTFGISVKF
ncbi:MAG: hypothetical protein OEZ22_08355 [Spirochaetia bacterium]|nr:hypothetical protein [Spirochaetia bacterium]